MNECPHCGASTHQGYCAVCREFTDVETRAIMAARSRKGSDMKYHGLIQMIGGRHRGLIRMISGRPWSSEQPPHTVPALQSLLDRHGVKNFSAVALTRVRHPDKLSAAERRGLPQHGGAPVFLPGVAWWERIVALAVVLQRLRDLVGEPIDERNLWRPPGYNAAVGGEPESDHIGAYAVDVGFRSRRAINEALTCIVGPMWRTRLFELSLGIGSRVMHLGLFAGRGQRCWSYDNYGESWVHQLNAWNK